MNVSERDAKQLREHGRVLKHLYGLQSARFNDLASLSSILLNFGFFKGNLENRAIGDFAVSIDRTLATITVEEANQNSIELRFAKRKLKSSTAYDFAGVKTTVPEVALDNGHTLTNVTQEVVIGERIHTAATVAFQNGPTVGFETKLTMQPGQNRRDGSAQLETVLWLPHAELFTPLQYPRKTINLTEHHPASFTSRMEGARFILNAGARLNSDGLNIFGNHSLLTTNGFMTFRDVVLPFELLTAQATTSHVLSTIDRLRSASQTQ